MRKSNNYFKFLEYVTYGKDHDNTIDKGNRVLECKSYASISDIEYRYNITFGLENEWLTLKSILINEDTLYVYYLENENSTLVGVYLLDNFKTQKELKYTITEACTKFLYDILLEKSEAKEKHYDDYTSEDFINAGIAKECTECTDFCVEDCIENAKCACGNDVFDGCKQKPPKTETNKIKGHIYIDTDSVKGVPLPEQQTGEESIIDTIISDDNIAYQTAKVTKTKHSVLDIMQCMMCPADREGNRCGGKQCCRQTWERYAAIVNPEWHHVNLATLANIDFDMLDVKRQIYFNLNKDFKKMCNDLRKCKRGRSFDARLCNFRAKLTSLNTYEKISLDMSKYLDRQISMMNVECGMWTSRVEIATGCHKSRKYNHHALKY